MARFRDAAYGYIFRGILLCAFCGFLIGANACSAPTTVVSPISITANDITDKTTITTTTNVTRIDNSGSCEYRLEYMPSDDKIRGISEVGGNRGSAQRINTCTTLPPAFVATMTSNIAWFEEQSAYYWAKKSRDYAKSVLWVTPPGWQDGPFTLAESEVSLSVLTVGDEVSGFRLACAPRGQGADGCMRYWPGQNPKIYIPAGRAIASVVNHEYGHYAAGYVFGHMDTLGSGGFKIDNCVHRAFQEGIAEIFEQLLVHNELTSAAITTPNINVAGLNSQWSNDCGRGEYVMSDPLWEAFTQAVWGTRKNSDGTSTIVPWPNAANANTTMANAFTFALLKIKDFRMHDFAVTALNHIDRNQTNEIAKGIRSIFAGHGLVLAANGKQCIENQECSSNNCDNGEGTAGTRLCMPRGGTGQDNDPCTHDTQCASGGCAGLVRNMDGSWIPGNCVAQGSLGAPCNTNTQCRSTYCDAGYNTANTNKCMPRGRTGVGGDLCSHDSQCASSNCNGLMQVGGDWLPGRCI